MLNLIKTMKNHKNYKILYLLHEMSHREFESKVFLGLEFLKKGWKVYVLQRNFFFLNLDNLPAGLVIYKSSVPSDLKIFKDIKKKNHKLVCLDEESISEFKSGHELNLKYGEDALRYLDLLIVTHDRTIKILNKKFKFLKKKLFKSLHPRFDFISFINKYKDPMSEKIKKDYKNFVFLPTTFYCNHLMGKNGFKRVYEEAFVKLNKKQNIFLEKLYNRDKIFIKKYTDLFHYFGKKLKNINFVLRPHPMENIDYWKKFEKKFNNFKIDYRYPSFYYQKAADSIVQFNSTIAFESFFLNNRSLQYQPINDTKDNYQTQIYGIEKFIKKIKTKKNMVKEVLARASKKRINNQKPNDFQSKHSKAIFRRIQALGINKNYTGKIFFPKKTNIKNIYRYILYFLSKFYILNLLPQKILNGKLKILRKKFIPIHANFFIYKSIKYYSVSEERFNFINKIARIFLKTKNFNIKRIYQNNFELVK